MANLYEEVDLDLEFQGRQIFAKAIETYFWRQIFWEDKKRREQAGVEEAVTLSQKGGNGSGNDDQNGTKHEVSNRIMPIGLLRMSPAEIKASLQAKLKIALLKWRTRLLDEESLENFVGCFFASEGEVNG